MREAIKRAMGEESSTGIDGILEKMYRILKDDLANPLLVTGDRTHAVKIDPWHPEMDATAHFTCNPREWKPLDHLE